MFCPRCKRTFRVPDGEELDSHTCPYCGYYEDVDMMGEVEEDDEDE